MNEVEVTKCFLAIDDLSSRLHIAKCTLNLAAESVEDSYQLIPPGMEPPARFGTNIAVINGVIATLVDLERELDELLERGLLAVKEKVDHEQ